MNKAFFIGIIPSSLISVWIHSLALDQQVPFSEVNSDKDPQIELKEEELALGAFPQVSSPLPAQPTQSPVQSSPNPKTPPQEQQAFISPKVSQAIVAEPSTEPEPPKSKVNHATQAEGKTTLEQDSQQTESLVTKAQEPIEDEQPSQEHQEIESKSPKKIEQNIETETKTPSNPDENTQDIPAKNELIQNFDTDFPHFENASTGCFGSVECREIDNVGSFRSVGKTLIQQLKAQGITVRFRDDLEDTGRAIYELTEPNKEVYFLHVFSVDLGKAVYFIAQDIRSLQDIQDASHKKEEIL